MPRRTPACARPSWRPPIASPDAARLWAAPQGYAADGLQRPAAAEHRCEAMRAERRMRIVDRGEPAPCQGCFQRCGGVILRTPCRLRPGAVHMIGTEERRG